ncbi:MAG: Hpt domain-containing protein, partial [Bacteroidota bacterium]
MVDLSFLKNFSKGKQAKFERYIRLYLSLAEESYEAMESGLAENDWGKVANFAHSLSPQATYMGIIGLKEVLARLSKFFP